MSVKPSRTERLAFWRDEYARESFLQLREVLNFILGAPQGSRLRVWLTVSATVLYARPFKQRDAVRLSDAEVPKKFRTVHDDVIRHRDKAIAHRDPNADKKGVFGNDLPIISTGNELFIPTTSPAMEDTLVSSLLELTGILIPRLENRTGVFIRKYLPTPLPEGSYILSLEENPAEWLIPAAK